MNQTQLFAAPRALPEGFEYRAEFLDRAQEHELLAQIPKSVSATPTVGEIHINPFLLQVEIRDFALAGSQSEKLLGFERLFVDFDLSAGPCGCPIRRGGGRAGVTERGAQEARRGSCSSGLR